MSKQEIRLICMMKRMELNITQNELAKRVGVRLATINEFESAKHQLGSGTLDKIFKVLKLKTVSKIEKK